MVGGTTFGKDDGDCKEIQEEDSDKLSDDLSLQKRQNSHSDPSISPLIEDLRIPCPAKKNASYCNARDEHHNGNTRLQKFPYEQKKDTRTKMELPGLRSCYEQTNDVFMYENFKKCSATSSAGTFAHEEMCPTSIQQSISKEFIDNYCKALNALEKQREEISNLRNEKQELENKLQKNQKELRSQKKLAGSEKRLRERIQESLRNLADELELGPLEGKDIVQLSEENECSTAKEADIEFYKDQFRIYQEDFKLEREEKVKLRDFISQLRGELEEAKQTIESQQKKLLVYAQLFNNSAGNEVVIPPAYIGRRVHSNPTTPSYFNGKTFDVARTYYPACDTRETTQRRKVVFDPVLDVVPKGNSPVQENKVNSEGRKQSLSDGEIYVRKNFITKRRTSSVI